MDVDFDSLTEDDALAVLVRLARSYRARFRRTLPLTREPGELYTELGTASPEARHQDNGNVPLSM